MGLFDELDDGRVAIPFTVSRGRLRFYLGGQLPRLKEGTSGEMLVYPQAIIDEQFRELLAEQRDVPFLKAGTLVFAAMNPASADEPVEGRLVTLNSGHRETVFGEIELLETQYLRLRGARLPRLTPARCQVGALDKEALSLNHAYTMLSQEFETHRTSHTANVFEKLFVCERGKQTMTRLNDLRSRREVLFEGRLESPE